MISCILSASSTVLTNAVQQIPCRDGCTWAPVLDGVFLYLGGLGCFSKSEGEFLGAVGWLHLL